MRTQIKEPYEMMVAKVEEMRERYPLYGGTVCWEIYQAARSRGLTPEAAYSKMLEVR